MTGVRSRPGPVGIAGAAACCTGLVLVALATFLPWFRSGLELRDSYRSISLIRTIRLVDGGPLEPVLFAWTMIIPVITISIVAYAFGFRRTGATIAMIVAIICGTVGGIAAVESSSYGVIAGTGPTVMLIGGVLALIGAVGVFIGRRQGVNVSGGEP
ncbi:hypothetical protein [Actinophytocola sp.]|uniref:hypothetical protein n=1 Tax=Actinophytocola sp. TaxID=1872138 RepID=UPI002D7EAF34|nr:hypothetical protein [Actinophytocola sp.]HET9142878.1 hypothetical protein [Actinophytocola sp.]